MFPNIRVLLNFLKYILDQEKDSLISRFFMAQKENPMKGDWVSQVKKLMTDMDFNLTFADIVIMKKKTFKKMVDRQVKKASLEYLLSKI